MTDQEAFESKLATRRTAPAAPEPLRVFYHVALLEGAAWIYREQLALLKFLGLTSIHVGIVGHTKDAEAFLGHTESVGVAVSVRAQSPEVRLHEHPTLVALYEDAIKNPNAAYLYLHTKGASAPTDETKIVWRRLMQRYLVSEFRFHQNCLYLYDIIGCNWQHSPDFPHYQGNFWMARGDWIASLEHPRPFRDNNLRLRFAGQDWRRMHCEAWLGSRRWHHMLSTPVCNHDWFRSPATYLPHTIEGFSYDAFHP